MGRAPKDTKLYPMLNNTKSVETALFLMFLRFYMNISKLYNFNSNRQLAPCLHGISTTV